MANHILSSFHCKGGAFGEMKVAEKSTYNHAYQEANSPVSGTHLTWGHTLSLPVNPER
jgi:hypothetical protein